MSKLALSRPNIILSKNRSKAIGIDGADGPCSFLIKNNWKVDDILSLCMPLANHKTPNKIDGALSESYKESYLLVFYSCGNLGFFLLA